jgi:hypothetical protein
MLSVSTLDLIPTTCSRMITRMSLNT